MSGGAEKDYQRLEIRELQAPPLPPDQQDTLPDMQSHQQVQGIRRRILRTFWIDGKQVPDWYGQLLLGIFGPK